MHGEEIRRVIELADQGELVSERRLHGDGNACGITGARAGRGEGCERRLWRFIALAQLGGIMMDEFVKTEGEAVEEADRLFDRLRRLGEQARHFVGGFEMTLGVGL